MKMLEPWAASIEERLGRAGEDRDLSVDVARRLAAAAVPAGGRRRRRHHLDGERLHARAFSRAPRSSSCRRSSPTTSRRPTSRCATCSTSSSRRSSRTCTCCSCTSMPARRCRWRQGWCARRGDTQGLKLRVPGPTGNAVVEAMGATPVTMPVPDLPQALSTNAVDGALIPWEIIPALQLYETTQYQIEGPNQNRFGTTTFQVSMNKARWEGAARRSQGGVRRALRRGLAAQGRRDLACLRRWRHRARGRERQRARHADRRRRWRPSTPALAPVVDGWVEEHAGDFDAAGSGGRGARGARRPGSLERPRPTGGRRAAASRDAHRRSGRRSSRSRAGGRCSAGC